MKRFLTALLALAVLLAPCALADMVFDGSVTAGVVTNIEAPYSADIARVCFKAGDRIEKGDLAFTMATKRNYAPCEGTISGIFAEEGDYAESVTKRYGAILYIEPINKYVVTATTEKAYNVSENKFIHIGEEVYLLCTADGSHQGRGIVTGFSEDGASYNIEAVSGEFSMEETVGVFRSPDHDTTSRIGRGTVSANTPVAVDGSGSIIKMHVKNGETVERGELLFETVDSELDGLFSPGADVKSEVSGIVASVEVAAGAAAEKGAGVLTVYSDDDIEVQVSVRESELEFIDVGQKVIIEFNWDANQSKRFDGEVTRISYINDEGEGEPTYAASIAFTPDSSVRLGMTVTVYTVEEDTEEAATEAD